MRREICPRPWTPPRVAELVRIEEKKDWRRKRYESTVPYLFGHHHSPAEGPRRASFVLHDDERGVWWGARVLYNRSTYKYEAEVYVFTQTPHQSDDKVFVFVAVENDEAADTEYWVNNVSLKRLRERAGEVYAKEMDHMLWKMRTYSEQMNTLMRMEETIDIASEVKSKEWDR